MTKEEEDLKREHTLLMEPTPPVEETKFLKRTYNLAKTTS
jgi:hypothetical protein